MTAKEKRPRRVLPPQRNSQHTHFFFSSVHRIRSHSRDTTLNTCCASKGYVCVTAAIHVSSIQFTVAGIKRKEQQHRCICLGLFLFRRVKTSLPTAMLVFGDGAIESFRIFCHASSTKSPIQVYGQGNYLPLLPWKVSVRTKTVLRLKERGQHWQLFLLKTSCGQLPNLLAFSFVVPKAKGLCASPSRNRTRN